MSTMPATGSRESLRNVSVPMRSCIPQPANLGLRNVSALQCIIACSTINAMSMFESILLISCSGSLEKGSAILRPIHAKIQVEVRGCPARDILSLGAMGQGPGRFPDLLALQRARFWEDASDVHCLITVSCVSNVLLRIS